MIRAILIDDQPLCTELLKDLIEKDYPQIEISAICHSGKEGLRAIRKHSPDLIILDVEMPGMTGFEMLQQIASPGFDIIFTTAFDKYSIQAIRYSALDYLLKPVLPHELKAAIDKVLQKADHHMNKYIKTLFKNLQELKKPVNQIAVPSSDGLLFVNIADIIHCESDSNYTTLFMKGNEKVIVSKTLKDVESLLEGNNFFRIHHSHLINMIHIKKFLRGKPGMGHVQMSNGQIIAIARNKKDDFLNHFAHL